MSRSTHGTRYGRSRLQERSSPSHPGDRHPHFLAARAVRPGFPIGNGAMLARLKELGAKCSLHRFRSAFADWAQDHKGVQDELIPHEPGAHQHRHIGGIRRK